MMEEVSIWSSCLEIRACDWACLELGREKNRGLRTRSAGEVAVNFI